MRGAAILALLLSACFIPVSSHAKWPQGTGIRATGLLPVDLETGDRSTRGGEVAVVHGLSPAVSLALTAAVFTRRDGQKDEWLRSLIASVEVSPPARFGPWIGFGLGIGRQRQAFEYVPSFQTYTARFDQSRTDDAMSIGGGLRFDASPRFRLRTGIEMRAVGGEQSVPDAPRLNTVQFTSWTASVDFFPGR